MLAFWNNLLKRGADPYADAEALAEMLEQGMHVVRIPFFINQTDLLAATPHFVISPIKGRVRKLAVVVQVDVTTGGAVTVEIGGTAVAGLTVTVEDAPGVGTVYTDDGVTADDTENVAKDGAIEIVTAAAFDTAGAIHGFIEVEPRA